MANETKSVVQLDNWAQQDSVNNDAPAYVPPRSDNGRQEPSEGSSVEAKPIVPAGSSTTKEENVRNEQTETSLAANARPENKSALDLTLSTDAEPYMDESVKPKYFLDESGRPKDADRKFGNMQDVIDFLEERKAAIHLPTKEELEKERRRKKTDGIISAIADGASAISNLIFTTRYAPNMYKPENSMSDKVRERYDRIKKERDADADRYLNYALTIGKLKDAQDDKQYQHGRDALKDMLAKTKADRDAAIAQLQVKLTQGKISEQDAKTALRQIQAEYAPLVNEAHIGEMNSRTNKNNRWQPSSGRSGSSGGGGSRGRHPWRDTKGVFGTRGAIIYESSAEGAREMAATHGGEYLTTETVRTTETTDAYGDPKLSVSRTNKSTPKKKTNVNWK